MKTTAIAIALLGFLPAALGQESASLAPSPTESVGCEPHGDHWHCEGARTETVAEAITTATIITSTPAVETDEAGNSAELAPSPTESVGCEPHGDHWHCEGPRTTLATEAAATTTEAHDDHDHDHDDHDHDDHEHTDETGTASLAPSPTESVGCEPHGDHWHCDGPVTTSSTLSAATNSAGNATATSGAPTTEVTNGAGLKIVPVVGMFAAALLAI